MPPKAKKRRTKSRTSESSHTNKWDEYYKKIDRLLLAIIRAEHAINVYSYNPMCTSVVLTSEISKQQQHILSSKLAVTEVLKSLDSENADDTRYSELGYESDNSIDVQNIDCSRCNLPDTEGNDILLCDKIGCNRAYHQECLDPPLLSMDFKGSDGLADADEDWFCWQCDCIDKCIDLINDRMSTKYSCIGDVFKEELATLDGSDKACGIEESDSDDSDYSENNHDVLSVASSSGSSCDGERGRSKLMEKVSDSEVEGLLAESGCDGVMNSRSRRRIKTVLGCDVTPEEVVIGHGIARVRAGYLYTGEVLEELSGTKEHMWKVSFADDSDAILNWSSLRDAIQLRAEYDLKWEQKELEESREADQKRENSLSLVLNHKRFRPSVDYVKLNEALFGDSVDTSATGKSEVELMPASSRRKKKAVESVKTRKKRKIKHRS